MTKKKEIELTIKIKGEILEITSTEKNIRKNNEDS